MLTKLKKFKPYKSFNRTHGIVIVALVAVAGTYFLIRAFALVGASNTVTLDSGICTNNDIFGSAANTTGSATPTFILVNDGAIPSYQVYIDGTSMGTFTSTDHQYVCITVPTPLSNGPHALTATELSPRPNNPVTPYSFTVDTTPPPTPSGLMLDPPYNAGGNKTTYSSPEIIGMASPNEGVYLFVNGSANGGSEADSSGNWKVVTAPLSPGTYTITADSESSAGVESPYSAPLTIYVNTNPTSLPTVSITSPSPSAEIYSNSYSIDTTVTANDGGSIASVGLSLDGSSTPTTPLTSAPYDFSLNTLGLSDGPHTITITATDDKGDVGTSTLSVVVGNGDVNLDGKVNISDLSILASNWGKSNQTYAEGNITGQSTDNISDLSVLAANWGESEL